MGRHCGPRTTQIFELRRRHPDWPLARIGDEVGVSKQWVNQVLKRYGLHTDSRIYSDNPGVGFITGYSSKRPTVTSRGNVRRSTVKKPLMAEFTKIPLEEAMAMKRPKARATVLEEYKKYVFSLGPNEASRFTVSNDKEGQMLRTRIKRSADALGMAVKVKKVRNEILFWYENGSK